MVIRSNPNAIQEGPRDKKPLDSLVIDIDVKKKKSKGLVFEETEHGLVETDEEHEHEDDRESEHDENLAENLGSSYLGTIAVQVQEWVEGDIESRVDWFDRLADGVKLLGVIRDNDTDETTDGAFSIVDKVSHPLISEACTQFQARAISELVPASGPVKTTVLGESSDELTEQAERVQDYMNYMLMVENEDYYPEMDAMLFTLALEGSQFKKTYHDPLTDSIVSRHIRAENFIVPYGAKSLKQAPRYTHQIEISRNDMKKLQESGFYLDIPLVLPSEGPTLNDKIKDTRERAQGETENANLYDDIDHTVWECHCDYIIKGHDDKDDIALPYIISVDKESMQVLAIRRNWDEEDEKKEKEVSFVHFPFIPGDGFYSYGLLHIIGGLGSAATGMLKIIILGSAFSAIRGGFKTKDSKVPGSVQLKFGEYIEVDSTYEQLKNTFFEPNFKEPGPALFQALEFVTQLGQRFASTTENMVGDASNTGPVGTTVALIEQGSKVFSGNHKRLHYAQGREFAQLAKLLYKYLPEEGYPYKVAGGDKQIFARDFDDRVDVLPVSDPNIFSSTQRIAQGQALRQMATEKPQLYNQYRVEEYMVKALRIPDPDSFLIDPDHQRRRDPIAENMCMMAGIPVMAFEDQDHDSHAQVCQQMIGELGANPDPVLKELLPAFYAHLAQHIAYAMRNKMAQVMQMTLPAINLKKEADTKDDDSYPEIDVETDAIISQAAARAVGQLPKPQTGGSPEMEEMAAQLEDQAKTLQKREEEQQKAIQLIESEGKKLNEAQQKVDKTTEMLKHEEELAEANHKMQMLQLDKKECDMKLAIFKERVATQKVNDQAVADVERALDKKSTGDDKRDAKFTSDLNKSDAKDKAERDKSDLKRQTEESKAASTKKSDDDKRAAGDKADRDKRDAVKKGAKAGKDEVKKSKEKAKAKKKKAGK